MKEKSTDTQLGDQVDWRELLFLLWDGRHVIAACTGLLLTVAVAYAMTLTPIYRANGFVLFEETAKGIPNLDDTTQAIGSDSSAAKELFVVDGDGRDDAKLGFGKDVCGVNAAPEADLHQGVICVGFSKGEDRRASCYFKIGNWQTSVGFFTDFKCLG